MWPACHESCDIKTAAWHKSDDKSTDGRRTSEDTPLDRMLVPARSQWRSEQRRRPISGIDLLWEAHANAPRWSGWLLCLSVACWILSYYKDGGGAMGDDAFVTWRNLSWNQTVYWFHRKTAWNETIHQVPSTIEHSMHSYIGFLVQSYYGWCRCR